MHKECDKCGFERHDLPAISPNGWTWHHDKVEYCLLAMKKTYELRMVQLELRIARLEQENQTGPYSPIEI